MLSMILACAQPPQDRIPEIPREFRAVWVATVDHIDWPNKNRLRPDEERADLVRLLDRAASLKLNTVIFQVRPSADALYRSSIEPWSEYLTGRQGEAPNPYYDPLEFAIHEAHKRGLQLHAWFNPYRAELTSAARGPLASSHIARTHPELVRKYADLLWMDPGMPEVRERSLDVILDVVKRYDIDGVHLDDYFYPYPEGGKPFPDDSSYAKYGQGLSKLDWRHKNVDDFIEELNHRIHIAKPWISFGISPFGIYRPGIPAGIKAGVDQYTDLSSDPVKWLQQGWCDYLSPQLYWPIDQKAQSFPVLLSWWRSQNTLHRHVWPGLYTSRVLSNGRSSFTAQEVVHQIQVTRNGNNDPGEIHFSIKALSQDAKGIDEYLLGDCYQNYALSPASPWLDPRAPSAPDLSKGPNGRISWIAGSDPTPENYVVLAKYGSRWQYQILPGDSSLTDVPPSLASGRLSQVAVAAVSRTGILGRYAVVNY